MAALTLPQIFGSGVTTDINPNENKYLVTLDLRNFQNVSDGGEITNNRGITNLATQAVDYQNGNKAVNLLYAILLLTLQNQAENIFSDPEQKIFINEGRKAFATGSREGQIIQNLNLSLFSHANIPNLPDIDDVGGNIAETSSTNNEAF